MNRAICLILPMLFGTASLIPASRQVAATWRIDSHPIFDVGDETGDTLDTFGRVMGTARLSNGQVIVADYKSFSLRYFASSGHYLRSVGRRGDGPGEFSAGLC